MNPYILDFDIAAIIIYIVIIFTYFTKKHVNNVQHKIFLFFYICSFSTAIADIIASIFINISAPFIPVMIVNTFYYLNKQCILFTFLLYILSQLEMERTISKKSKSIMVLPILLTVSLILINPFTDWIFSYKDGKYERGPFIWIVYLVGFFYYVWTVLYAFKNRKILNKILLQLVFVIGVISIVFELIQYIFPNLLLHSFALSLSFLLIQLNMERYGMVIDSITGMAKKEHLETICKKMIYNAVPFRLVIIRMVGYDLLVSNYGTKNFEIMVHEIEKYLLKYVQAGYAFQISEDMFVLLIEGEQNTEQLQKTLYKRLSSSWIVNSVEMTCDFYVSSVSYPENAPNVDICMDYINYFEKLKGIEYGIVPIGFLKIRDRIHERNIVNAIKEAIEEGNFELYFQPIYDINKKSFRSAEALLRLKDPVLGIISPDEFIPISERKNFILQIGSFVLDSVCEFIENHDMERLGLEYIEVNLSSIQCLQQNFIDIVTEITTHHNIDSKYLCFEITETAANYSPYIFTENLKLLNEKGFSLALDDFGTGYGNLERMITSDFSIIKFDKIMTQTLSKSLLLQKVYKTLIAMIKTMGSKIVSEGVETQEQYEFVKSAGCDYIQGYYFSKPLPEAEFLEFLNTASTKVENL